MVRYKLRNGRMVAAKPALPGVYQCEEPGLWHVRKVVTDPRRGKRLEVSRFVQAQTALEAAIKLQELVAEKLGAGAQKEAPRFSSYATGLLEKKQLLGEINSNAGVRRWQVTLDHHLIPAFGDFYLDKLTRADVSAWLVEQAKKVKAEEYAPTTVNAWFSILKVILNTATLELELERNPIAGVKPLDTSTHQTYSAENPNAVPPEKLPAFLQALKEHYPQHYAQACLGFATGLRPSSMRPLRRRGANADVLWDGGKLLIRRSQTEGDPMNRTKTGKEQTLHLPPELMSILKEHTEKLKGRQLFSELLFPSKVGGYQSRNVLDKPFEKVSKLVGIPTVSARGMRRTAQDLHRRNQVSGVVLRSISGHSSEEMTSLYSTVSAAEQVQALAQVVQLFKAQG